MTSSPPGPSLNLVILSNMAATPLSQDSFGNQQNHQKRKEFARPYRRTALPVSAPSSPSKYLNQIIIYVFSIAKLQLVFSQGFQWPFLQVNPAHLHYDKI